jgi:hypothetical protein
MPPDNLSNKSRYKYQNPQITDALPGNTSQYEHKTISYTFLMNLTKTQAKHSNIKCKTLHNNTVRTETEDNSEDNEACRKWTYSGKTYNNQMYEGL